MINPSNKVSTDFIYEYGLYINRATPPHMTDNHSHLEIEILHMRRGSGRFIIGEQPHTADPESFFLFWATTPHRLVDVEPDSEFYVMMVPLMYFINAEIEQQLESLLLSSQIINHRFDSDVQKNMFYAYLDQWIEDKERGELKGGRQLGTEFAALLRRMNLPCEPVSRAMVNQASRSKDRAKDSGQRELEQISTILRYIVGHFQEPLTAEQISRQADLHPDYAAALFRRVMGKTFLQYLTEYRVQIAIGLLQNTTRAVLDIALDCGFRSSSQFYASFKKVTGKSPKEYRTTRNRPF